MMNECVSGLRADPGIRQVLEQILAYSRCWSRSWHTAGTVLLFRSTMNSDRKIEDLSYALSLPFPLKSHKKKKREDMYLFSGDDICNR